MLQEMSPVNKHTARFIAILALYSHEMQAEISNLNKVTASIKQNYLNKDMFDSSYNETEFHLPDEELLERLISTYALKSSEIESFIKQNLIEKYSFEKLDKVIKAALNLAALELLYCGDVSAKIIIDEYVGLIKVFYDDAEAGFVNKVIDIMARSVRATEFNEK